jgi:exopolysaccharide biosynthesis polyprenyl glycosylphosphotransferase
VIRQKDSAAERGLWVLLDLLAFFLAANLAFDLRYYVDWGELLRPGPAPWGELYRGLPYLLLGYALILATFGLYRPGLKRREEVALLAKAQLVAFLIIFATAFFYRGFSYSRAAALMMVPIAFLLNLGLRLAYRALRGRLLRLRSVEERLVIVGYSDETTTLIRRLTRPGTAYRLMGVLCHPRHPLAEGVERLGTRVEDLGEAIDRTRPERVLLVSGALSHAELVAAIEVCDEAHVGWGVVPDLYDLLVDRLHLDQVAGIPVMGPAGSNIVGMNRVLKRGADLVLASALGLVLLPCLGLIALLVRLSSPGPALFVQERVGRHGRPFRIFKFRSMRAGSDDRLHQEVMERVIEQGQTGDFDGKRPIFKLRDDPRVTRLGRFLRRYSLDELPQLWNVLRGDMSLVGPRPAVPHEVARYRERHRRRLEVQPGLTGLWQVSGRNRLSFEEMVELDIQYLENWSLGLDARIVIKTLIAVLATRGY